MAIEVTGLCKDYHVYVGRKRGLLKNLRRSRETVSAVRDLNLHVSSGEVIGLIGENGSGKSTTIKMLTGILNPSGGTVRVNGVDPFKNRKQNARQISAIMGQKSQLWWDLPVFRSFDMLKSTYSIPDADYRTRLDTFVEMNRPLFAGDPEVRILGYGKEQMWK